MKKYKTFLPALLLAAFAIHANAYYLENAIAGKVTIKVTGACAIPAAQTNAYLANISDDEHNPLGWGIVTASGHLLALRENKVEIANAQNYATKAQKMSEFVDLAGDTLKSFLTTNGVRCEIAWLQPHVNSKVTYASTGTTTGRASMIAGFGGYEIERCQDKGDAKSCVARKITGSIKFKGSW